MIEKSLELLAISAELTTDIRAYGLLALVCFYQNQKERIMPAVEHALELMSVQLQPTSLGVFSGYMYPAEAMLALWAVQGDNADEQIKELAQKTCKRSAQFARIIRLGRPHNFLLQGRLAWLKGRQRTAITKWQRGIEAAKQLTMRYDEALLHHELGQRLPSSDPKQTYHQNQARTIFKEIGAAFHLNDR